MRTAYKAVDKSKSAPALAAPPRVAVAPARHAGASRPLGGFEGGRPPALGGFGEYSRQPAASSELQDTDIAHLLRALQRANVHGADPNVGVLCQKFSRLLRRLQRAEQREQASADRNSVLEVEVRAEETATRGAREEHEAAAAHLGGECGALARSLAKAQQDLMRMQGELHQAQNSREELAKRRAALDEQRASERSRFSDANTRIRQLRIYQPGVVGDLTRLHERFEELRVRYAASATELKSCMERTYHDEARTHELRTEVAQEDEILAYFTETAALQRNELREAMSDISTLRERSVEVQAGLQCCEDQLSWHIEGKQALCLELQRREAWLASSAVKAEGLRRVERGLEKVLADTAETKSQLSVEEQSAYDVERVIAVVESTLTDVEARLSERAHSLAELELETTAERADEAAAQEDHEQLEATLEQLSRDQAASGWLHQHLESEMQLLFTETEALQRERDDVDADTAEMHQRLALISPGLREVRSHVRDLEDRVEAARAASDQEQVLISRYEREIVCCQDKSDLLRDESVQLVEQCTELEAELVSATTRRTLRGATPVAAASSCFANKFGVPPGAIGVHAAVELLDLFGLQMVAKLRFEIPNRSFGDQNGHLLKNMCGVGDSTASIDMIEVSILDVQSKEEQDEAYEDGTDTKVHLSVVRNTDPKVILEKLDQMKPAEQDSLIRAFINESVHNLEGVERSFRYLALNHQPGANGDMKNEHTHVGMRSYRFTNDVDYLHGDIKFVLESKVCGRESANSKSGCRPKMVKISTVGRRVTRCGFKGARFDEYEAGDLLLQLKVLPSDIGAYLVRNIVKVKERGSFSAPPPRRKGYGEIHDRSAIDSVKVMDHGIALVYTHNLVVPKKIAVDILQNETVLNAFYGLGDHVTPETDGHLTALSHKIEGIVANKAMPTYGKLRANTGHAIDITKLKGSNFVVQANLLATMSADDELMHAGMLVELVPRERYFERHPFDTAPFVSLESLQTRSFSFVTGMLDGMPELEFPKWEKEAYGTKAAPTIKKQFNDLVSIPNGPWQRRVVGKLLKMFPDATSEDRLGTAGNEAMWNQGLIRRKHRVANYPKGYQFKERIIVPLASIVRGNYMHECGTDPKKAVDFVNRPLQYVHFDAPKPAQDGSMDCYGLNTHEGLAKIARLRRDWPLQHMLAVPQVGQMVKKVAAARGNASPSHSDLMLILARDMLKETKDQEIFNRLFVREALNIWTDVTPTEALTRDYLKACSAYGSEAEMNTALAKTNGKINPGKRFALMDAHTLSDIDFAAERTNLIMQNPRFIDLAAEAKVAYAEDPDFQKAHAGSEMRLLKVADIECNRAAEQAQKEIGFKPEYPKLPQYPCSVLNKALSTHRWYMAEESRRGDGFLLYLDESPHTATFENSTHPRLSVETRILIVDILEKDSWRVLRPRVTS